MDVAILALEGCMPSAVIGIGDILAIANDTIERRGGGPRFRCRTISLDGGDVVGARGVTLRVRASIADGAAYDAIVVPGFLTGLAALESRPAMVREAAAWLRQRHAEGRIVAAFCTGVFVLAEAGLLDGRRATTTWWLQSELQARRPAIDLAVNAVVTEADNVVCAAGPMSWIDLALRLVETAAGREAARACADLAVLDLGARTQAAYLPQGFLLRRDPWLVEAEMVVRQAGAQAITTRALAQALGMSERTLHRRMRTLAGQSSQAFIAGVRMAMARTLLETTAHSVKKVAHQLGYDDESSFRRAFRRATTLSPGRYRARRAAS